MDVSWHDIQDSTNTVYFTLSSKGIVLSVTRNFYKITGLKKDSILGSHVGKFLGSDILSNFSGKKIALPVPDNPYEFFTNFSLNGKPKLSALVNIKVDKENGYFGSASFFKTHHKQEEDAFKQKEIIRSTLRSIDDLVFVVDKDGVFVEYYNGQSNSKVFFSSDLFIGKNFEEVGFPPEVSSKFFSSLEEARQSGKTQQIQYSLKVFGSEFFYQAKLSPRYNNENEFEGATAICRDITSLKKIEKQLISSRDFYLSILQKFPTMVWRSDAQGRCDFFNNTWLEFTGLPMESQVGWDWIRYVHPNDREKVKDAFHNAIMKKKMYNQQYRLLHNSGKYRWVEDTGHPVYSFSNEFLGFIGSCSDVHQEIINRRLLVESEERYRNIVELHSDLLIRWSEDTTLTFVNKPFCRLLQKTEAQLKGKKFTELFNSSENKKLKLMLREASNSKSDYVFEQQISDQDGIAHWIQWVSSPIFDSAGNYKEFQSVGRDITSHVREEKEKEKLLEKLNRRVRELTFLNDFSSVIQQNNTSLKKVFEYLVNEMPSIFDSTSKVWIRVRYGEEVFFSKGFNETNMSHKEVFGKSPRMTGVIEQFVEFDHLHSERNEMLLNEMQNYLSIIRDVLETYVSQFEAEYQLQTTEEKYRELFESITDIVFVMDKNEKFSSINPAIKNMLGYDISESLNFRKIITPSCLPSVEKAFKEAVKELKSNIVLEIDVLSSTGELKNFLVNCLIKYKGSQWNEISGVARDVSESRQISRKLIKAIIETEEKERKRFAEELHDGLGPLLSGIKMYLQKADASCLLEEKDRKVIDYCTELTNEAIGQTRIIANNLMPNVLADFGLVKALDSFSSKINSLGKIKINITNNDDLISLQPVENVVVYRVITELINNALKYSEAEQVDIDLKFVNKVLKVVYFEKGNKFDPLLILQNNSNKGMGLKNIINRVKSVNGTLEFNNNNKDGFMVKILFASVHDKQE